MFHTPPPPEFIDLYETPAGRMRHYAMRENYQRVTTSPQSDPIAVIAASFDYRQLRYIDGGHEGLTGTASSYHLTTLCGQLNQAAGKLLDPETDLKGMPKARRIRFVLNYLAKVYGERYFVGVRGVTDALKEANTATGQMERFIDERVGFDERFVNMMQSAWIVNAKGDNPRAATECLQMLTDEMQALCDYRMGADPQTQCPLEQAELAQVREKLLRLEQVPAL